MAEEKTVEKKSVAAEKAKIDDHGESVFQSIGLNLSDNGVAIYNRFKRVKDQIAPGRLSAEGFATIVILAELADGKLDLKGKE
jgi:hypothetical protein